MASYLDKLRNSNVFGNPFSPSRQNPFALVDQFMRRNPQLNNIGQQMLGRNEGEGIQPSMEQERPMNVVFKDQISPLDQAKLDQRRAELEGRQDLGKSNLGIKRDEVGIKRDQLAINDFKSKNPGMKIESQKGGNFFAINPITGETKDLGINTGTWSDEEVSNAKGQQALEQIGARGGEDRNTEGVRQTGRVALAGVNNAASMERTKQQGQNAIVTKETPSGNLNSREEISRAQLNYNKLINANPKYRNFVKLDANGMPQIVEPKSSSWGGYGGPTGPTQTEYDEINNTIFGTNKPVKSETPPKVDDTKVIVLSPDGKTKGRIPKSQLADALKQGYTEVK